MSDTRPAGWISGRPAFFIVLKGLNKGYKKPCFWNEDDTEAHSVQQFTPALHIDEFFESFFALAKDGKLNDKGMPPFLQLPLMGLKHKDEIRVVSPPWAVQLLTYWTLAPISFLMGYRADYFSKNEATKLFKKLLHSF